jgi:hypothetical protein
MYLKNRYLSHLKQYTTAQHSIQQQCFLRCWPPHAHDCSSVLVLDLVTAGCPPRNSAGVNSDSVRTPNTAGTDDVAGGWAVRASCVRSVMRQLPRTTHIPSVKSSSSWGCQEERSLEPRDPRDRLCSSRHQQQETTATADNSGGVNTYPVRKHNVSTLQAVAHTSSRNRRHARQAHAFPSSLHPIQHT